MKPSQLFLMIIAIIVLPPPVFAGDICGGDALCRISFLAIGYAPYTLLLSALFFVLLRLTRPSVMAAKHAGISILAALLAVSLYHNWLGIWIEKSDIIRSERKALKTLGYAVYVPEQIPPGYRLWQAGMMKGYPYFHYRRGSGRIVVSQFRVPPRVSLLPPECHVYGGSRDNFEIWDGSSSTSSGIGGPCSGILTPMGRRIYLMEYTVTEKDQPMRFAMGIMGSTLVTVSHQSLSDDELTLLFDALKETDPDKIEIIVDDSRIGR